MRSKSMKTGLFVLAGLALCQEAAASPPVSGLPSTGQSGSNRPACKPLQVLSASLASPRPVAVEALVYSRKQCAPWLKGVFWEAHEPLPPDTFIGELTIREGKRSIDAPVSAFADLGDPVSVTLAETDKGFEFVIRGAGEGGYKATFKVASHRLLSRRVSAPGFEDDVFDLTQYHNDNPE